MSDAVRQAPGRALAWAIAGLVLAVATVVLFDRFGWDLPVQDRLFDFPASGWVVDSKDAVPRALLYRGPKVVLGLLALALLGSLLRPGAATRRLGWTRREPAYLFLCLVLVPVLVGLTKRSTSVPCPWDVDRYGGALPHLTLLSQPDGPFPERHCFPAAHASGGFALLGFAHVALGRRKRILTAVAALAVGWTLGVYQMARGAHFLSHTLVSMWLAVGLTSLLAWRLLPGPDRAATD